MLVFNSNSGKFPFRLGCWSAAIYLIVFFYFFPSSKDGFLYVFFWVLGFFMLPVIISVIFGAGTIFGFLMSTFLNIFRFRRKNPYEQKQYYHEENDNSEYINIDKYNQPDKDNDKLSE
jgi:hypothetical protein